MLRFVAQGYDYSRAVFAVILCSRRCVELLLSASDTGMHHALKYNNVNSCCESNFSSEGETAVSLQKLCCIFMVNWFVITE